MKGFLTTPKCGTNVEENNLFLKLENEATFQRERFIVSRTVSENCILNTYAMHAYVVDFSSDPTIWTKHIQRKSCCAPSKPRSNGYILDEEHGGVS